MFEVPASPARPSRLASSREHLHSFRATCSAFELFLRYFGSSLLVLLVGARALRAAPGSTRSCQYLVVRERASGRRVRANLVNATVSIPAVRVPHLRFPALIFFGTRALTYRPGVDRDARSTDLAITVVVGVVSAVVALTAAHSMADQWQTYLLAKHATGFGVTDPLHHRDMGFYVFCHALARGAGRFAGSILVLGGVGLASLASIYTLTSPYQTGAGDFRRVVTISSLFAAVLVRLPRLEEFLPEPIRLAATGRGPRRWSHVRTCHALVVFSGGSRRGDCRPGAIWQMRSWDGCGLRRSPPCPSWWRFSPAPGREYFSVTWSHPMN